MYPRHVHSHTDEGLTAKDAEGAKISLMEMDGSTDVSPLVVFVFSAFSAVTV
jgi:hypothetical protein